MRFIVKYIWPHKFHFGLAFFVKFSGTMMDLMIPWILANIIDNIIPLKSKTLILVWGFAMIICAFIGLFANIIANRLTSKSAILFARDLRNNVFDKVLMLSCKQIDSISVPSLISRISTDTYTLHQFVSLMQRMGSRAPIMLVGSIIMTMALDLKLALIMITMLPIVFLIVTVLTKKGIPLFDNTRKKTDIFTRTIRENITGVRVIKAFAKAGFEEEKFNKINTDLKRNNIKAEELMAFSNPLINLCLNFGIVLVILFGAVLVNAGYGKPGIIIAFMSYFSLLVSALLTVTRTFIMSSKSIASAKRLKEIMDLPVDEKIDKADGKTDTEYFVEFEHVSFSYIKKTDNLKNVSFKLKRGETLGIIGGTGSGKTTLINLLLGLYQADCGTVKINGIHIQNIPSDILYEKIGVVFQDDLLFQKSIKENIDFSRGLSEENIAFAAKCAQAVDFIETKDHTYDHQVAIRGRNLSGGQRQRLLIARALASTPRLLVLDDSLSALDYKTDAMLRNGINTHFKETTKIIVAQRINSIMHSDHIMVLEEGEIAAYGTHEELLASSRFYQTMYKSQIEA